MFDNDIVFKFGRRNEIKAVCICCFLNFKFMRVEPLDLEYLFSKDISLKT